MNPLIPNETQDAETKACCSTENLKEKVTDLVQTGESYIRAKPWAVVGVVFASGLALGLLISRREQEDRLQDCLHRAMKNLNTQSHEHANAVGHQMRKIGSSLKFW